MMLLNNPIPAPHRTISVCSSQAEKTISYCANKSNQVSSRTERKATTEAIRIPNPSTPIKPSLDKEYPKRLTLSGSVGMLSNNMRLSIPAAQPRIKFIRKLAVSAEEGFGKVCEIILQRSDGRVGNSRNISRTN